MPLLLDELRLEHGLEISDETENRLKQIYRDLYLAAQLTMEALLENNTDKAREVIDSKAHFNGMIELTRSHLYIRMKSGGYEHLELYKIETSTIENYRRIHNLLRRICKLMLMDDEAPLPGATEQPAVETGTQA